MGMTKKDIEIWYRIYLPTGGDTDMRMRPLEYRSFKDWQNALQEKLDEVNFTDFDIVDYSYLTQDEAWQMFHDKVVWEAYDNFFDLAKSNGIPPDVLKSALEDGSLEITEAEEFLENAYEGEYGSILDLAYDIVDQEMISDDQYEMYFDYDAFGFALVANGDINSIIMDDWEERYESELEAEKAYEGITDMQDDKIAIWYLDHIVGGDPSDLDEKTLKTFFNYKSFARDLEYEGFEEIDGFIFRPY
tara:strand:+ start:1208 stop:1945 length:738 start_codon:yes stop_codon:yes gene_type:complete